MNCMSNFRSDPLLIKAKDANFVNPDCDTLCLYGLIEGVEVIERLHSVAAGCVSR
jgi:hypothetical protein